MKTRILDSAEAVARAVADDVAAFAGRRPDLVLALPTGRTPVPLYDELAARCARGECDLSRARGFNLDELVLPRADPRTFRAFMEQHAWGRTGLRRDRGDIPDGDAPDLSAECRRYEEAIAAAGGLDLALLGVGVDGHVAYNMPGPISLPTHVTRLPDGLAASLQVPPSSWPLRALTMGIGTIRGARAIRVIATGARKATAVRMLVQGPENPDWPCSFLQSHPEIEVLMDAPAAAAL
ncbi:MAG: glucosamine-6-phosphate deaminase [Acidobacteria bacterium]|nr:MAG: glucosamine-6-phosphate deaminase [Acidobacteriota bacterium]